MKFGGDARRGRRSSNECGGDNVICNSLPGLLIPIPILYGNSKDQENSYSHKMRSQKNDHKMMITKLNTITK